jgi:hypothetical protein
MEYEIPDQFVQIDVKTQLVNVVRTVKSNVPGGGGEPNEHGPMLISEATKRGILSTSSGTVWVEIFAVGGDYDGLQVGSRNGKFGVLVPA